MANMIMAYLHKINASAIINGYYKVHIIINKAAAVTPIRLQGIPEFIEAEYNFSDLFC